MFLAVPLHDIGKIGIPDAILLKPGRLNNEEHRVIQAHCELGERILREPSLTQVCCETEIADSEALTADSLMEMARKIALSHHERWDESGYPQGLRKIQIPLAARIVCVADVYDALTSTRPYKAALRHDEAMRIIENGTGTQFDPLIVGALLESQFRLMETRKTVASGLCRIDQPAAAFAR